MRFLYFGWHILPTQIKPKYNASSSTYITLCLFHHNLVNLEIYSKIMKVFCECDPHISKIRALRIDYTVISGWFTNMTIALALRVVHMYLIYELKAYSFV